MKKLLLLLLLLAPCASSRVVAISCDQATLQAAVNAAARGATITCDGAAQTYTTPLSITKGITLIGNGTVITRTATTQNCQFYTTPNRIPCVFDITPDSTARGNNETISVSGFVFDGGGAITNFIIVNVPGVTTIFRNLFITSNTFRNAKTTVVDEGGAIYTDGQVRGLIGTNIFDRVFEPLRSFGNDSTTEWSNGLFPFAFGDSDNLFFEHNTCQFSSAWTGTDPCWIELGQGSRLVNRFNTYNLTNATMSGEGFDVHGFQNWNGTPDSGQTGNMTVEYYDNLVINPLAPNLGNRRILHRGSQGMYFDNVQQNVTGTSMMQMLQDVNGCASNISPTPNYNPIVNNTYEFNNTNDTGQQTWQVNTAGCGIANNVNYWSYTASFTGASGVGRGVLASRPPTCTTGVAYWATDQGSWNQSGSGIQGVLYKCTSTNTWALYYTPYTYPYPGSGSTAGKTRLRGH